MCGRYSLQTTRVHLARELGLGIEGVLDLPPRWNIAPTQPVAVVRASKEGTPIMALQRWGLVPSWANDPRMGSQLINARKESIATKPSFRDSFLDRRCLVLADGFYEWAPAETGAPRSPHYIRLRSRRSFTMAGLWSRWRSPAGEPLDTCTIITGPPNEVVERLHDRMPVILPPAARDAWLDPNRRDELSLLELLRTFPASELESYPVSRHVNSPDHDDPKCIAPIESPESDDPPDLFSGL